MSEDDFNRDQTECAALAVATLSSALTEIGWALARGETGPAYRARISNALLKTKHASDQLVRAGGMI